jgi:hypothetical protein
MTAPRHKDPVEASPPPPQAWPRMPGPIRLPDDATPDPLGPLVGQMLMPKGTMPHADE